MNPEEAPPPPEALEDVAVWLRWLTVAVVTGRVDARTAHEATVALKELRPTLEKIDLDRRVKELEKQLKQARKEIERRGH